MNLPILSSTFFITLLLMVGLFFFIRASAKDRTEEVVLVTEEPEISILEQVKQYFEQRSYRVTQTNAQEQKMTWEGLVRPSLFIASFVTLIAACGWLCLGLLLSFVYPNLRNLFFGLVILAPLAGIYYWQKAERIEQVYLQLFTTPDQKNALLVKAHRDELIQMQRALPVKVQEG